MTTETPALADFLLARLAEDEAEAHKAIAMRDRVKFVHPPEVPDLVFQAYEDTSVPIVIVGPERVLADVEAKRQIVERFAAVLDPFSSAAEDACSGMLQQAGETLCDLASIYSSHPDFNPDWQP